MVDECIKVLSKISCAFDTYEKETTVEERKNAIPALEELVEQLKECQLDMSVPISIIESHINKYKEVMA